MTYLAENVRARAGYFTVAHVVFELKHMAGTAQTPGTIQIDMASPMLRHVMNWQKWRTDSEGLGVPAFVTQHMAASSTNSGYTTTGSGYNRIANREP